MERPCPRNRPVVLRAILINVGVREAREYLGREPLGLAHGHAVALLADDVGLGIHDIAFDNREVVH